MKNLYKQKRNQGFTIIEVLIVLAIAALILLIVFLAVPALQRNSRNTSIKSQAADVLAGVNDYIANNNGTMPTGVTVTGNIVSITGTGTATEAKVTGGTNVTLVAAGCGAAAPALGTIAVHTGCKCDQPSTGTQASSRAIAAQFLTETNSANGTAPQCLES